ncbi:MAG: ribosome hibernation-promoting factor, HPF/YfiA family [Parachlamydiaceae bacterium]
MSRKAKALEFVNDQYDIGITGRNVLVTDAMKNYALEKLSKVERISPRIVEMNLVMDIQRVDHRVDIVAKINNLKIKSQAVTDDMYASIDKAVDKLEAQLLKYKNKIQDHHARGVKSIDMNVNVIQPHRNDATVEVNDEIEDENFRQEVDSYRPHAIVAKETRPLKYLTYDEAIMKMELSQDAFLIFINEADRKTKVIYRRKDGNYGIIEPEQG